MRYLYFVGLPHQKIHLRYIYSVLGGEYVEHPCEIEEKDFSDAVLSRDAEDAIWFFTDIHYHLHSRLKGKQVLIRHGLSFGPWMNTRRSECINRWFHSIFQTGRTQELSHRYFRVRPEKIKPLGYTLLFEIPRKPSKANAVLFSSTCFRHWNHYENLVRILGDLDPAIDGYLSVHPQTGDDIKNKLLAFCGTRANLKPIRTQEELLEAFAVCSYNISGGSSSLCAPFWYLQKPVIFLRGRYGLNPFRGIGWDRIQREVEEPLFARILEQSMKISTGKKIDLKKLSGLSVAPAARDVFYPWNFDEHETRSRLKQLVAEVEKTP